MRIGGENGGPLSPTTSLVASNSSDEMIESENEAVRDRVCDLEKKVLEQNDEIMCLRSTLADALRRITNIETSKGLSGIGRGIPVKEGITGIVKMRPIASDVRDNGRRPVSYIPGRNAASTPSTVRVMRRPTQYQSTSSLYSDGHSSSSASPAPSPSPTSNNVTLALAPPQRHLTPTPQSRPISTPLSKRWVSTSDFSSPANTLTHAFGTAFATSQASPLANRRDAQYNSEEGVVKLYLRGRPLSLYVPSHLQNAYKPQAPASPPNAKLKLEWVYGYRGKDCRNNVYQLPTGEIVYFIAAVVVLYNVEEQTQRHYLGHTDDIKCLAVHPNKMTVATGQTAGHDRRDSRPHIRIWDSVSLTTLHVIGISEMERSVASLSFSKTDGGGLLVAIDEAPDHNMSIWDWSRGQRGFKLMETKCTADAVLTVDFSPVDRNTIIVGGKNQISFWIYDNGMLSKKVGVFENRQRPKYVTALSFTDTGNAISGDSNGNLIIWQRGSHRVERSVKSAHDGSVFTILVQKDGTVISGGKDGQIREWTRDMKPTNRYIQVPEHYGAPRVVTCGRGSQLVVGTTRNCILGGTFDLPLQPLMQGHTDDLWGMTAHPTQNQFVTAGFDKTCYLWDSMSKSIVWKKHMDDHLLSCAFSPCGEVLLLGTTGGKWFVMHVESREIRASHQDGSEPIQVLKFSPNGRSVAIGSRDNNVYIYQVSEDLKKFSRVGRCLGHSSPVMHVDWSADSQLIRTNSGDYEILFWNCVLCRQVIETSEMRDVEWTSESCPLSFATIGCWADDGCDVMSCTTANHIPLLATGDDMGKVKLFSAPASQQKSGFVEASGHSSHISSVRFLHNDARLISTGGKDTAIMQWIVSGASGFTIR